MKKTIGIVSAYLALVSLVLTANLQGLFYNCFNAVDFGIYLQGIYGLANGELNPYVSVRHLKIFSDHFDPINFVPALFMKLTTHHSAVLMSFEWATIVLLSVLVFLLARKRLSLNMSLFMALLVFLNKPMLMALRFPVHPTTWSTIPLLLISYFLLQKNKWAVFFAALSLIAFKESYPFALFTLGFWYLLQKEFKTAAAYIGSSVVAIAAIFILRPWIIGEAYSHAGLLFESKQSGLLSFALDRIVQFRYFDLVKNLLPFLLVIVLYLKKQKSELKLSHPFVGLMFFLAPLMAMQFIANRFEFHYGSMFTALFLPLLFEIDLPSLFEQQKKLAILMIGLFVFNAGSDIEKMVAQVFFHKNRQCVISPEKKSSITSLLEKTKTLTKDDHLVLTGGAFNQVVRYGMNIYQIRGFSNIPQQFNTILLEIHPKEQSWPLSPEEIQKIFQQCRGYATEVLQEDQFFYLARGNFPKDCLN